MELLDSLFVRLSDVIFRQLTEERNNSNDWLSFLSFHFAGRFVQVHWIDDACLPKIVAGSVIFTGQILFSMINQVFLTGH